MLKLCSKCKERFIEKCGLCGKLSSCEGCGCKACQSRDNNSINQLSPTVDRIHMVRSASRIENPNFKEKKFFRKKRKPGYRPDFYDTYMEER